MSIDIDWSKAPEGATHYAPSGHGRVAAWYKQVCGHWTCWPDSGEVSAWGVTIGLPLNAIARPTKWDGDGLPPVGTKCEVEVHTNVWYVCSVAAHFEGRVVVIFDHKSASICNAEQLRPIRTPEQIAAEKREREINDLVETIVTHYEYPKGAESYVGLARALHKAGYRKIEQEQDQ